MKRLLLALMLALMPLSLTACNLLPPPVTSAPTLIDEKVMLAAELTFNTAAKAYLEMVDNDQLSAATKTKAKAGLNKAYDLLVVLRKTRSVVDAANFEAVIKEFYQ